MPVELLFILPVLLLVIVGGQMFIHWADGRRIVRMIVEQGGTVLGIERSFPGVRMLVSVSSTSFWRVRHRASDGTARIAECFATFLRCKIYADNPAR